MNELSEDREVNLDSLVSPVRRSCAQQCYSVYRSELHNALPGGKVTLPVSHTDVQQITAVCLCRRGFVFDYPRI